MRPEALRGESASMVKLLDAEKTNGRDRRPLVLISEAGTIEVGKMRASRLTGPWPQNITPARAKAYSEDDYARVSARLAQLRLVDGPLGIVAVETLEQLVGSILKASTHLPVWEGADVEARKWLMLSKGRHLTLARVRKRIWRNNALSRAQRARLLAAEKKGDAWLKYWDGEARANRADARAQIKRAKQHIRDLLVCFALAYKSAFTVGRVSPYSHVRAALWTKDARMWLPKTRSTSWCAWLRPRSRDTAEMESWPGAAAILRGSAESDRTIEPEIP